MRVPPFYAAFCLLLLLGFGYSKLRGLQYLPANGAAVQSSRGGTSSGGSRSSGYGGSGFFGTSSSHK